MTEINKSRALLFGLNYKHNVSHHLYGCLNDVQHMTKFLRDVCNVPCDAYTDAPDDINRDFTTAAGIVSKLTELALKSCEEDLDFVYIHFSGHGESAVDASGDEIDGLDEVLIPSDNEKTGAVVTDDVISCLLRQMNLKTRVVCVFDCCHSGTMADLDITWNGSQPSREPPLQPGMVPKLLSLSGCRDNQTSADAYNLNGDKQYSGALTSSLLTVLKRDPSLKRDVLAMYKMLQQELASRRFQQVPMLCSTHDLRKDGFFLPEMKSL
jgi:hypothetical protein